MATARASCYNAVCAFVGDVFTGKLDAINIAATHGHLSGKVEELVRSDHYAFVFHGHSHRRRGETIGRTRVINPGALGGLHPESRSIYLVNLVTGDTHFTEVAS
ncbi:MAG TPA: metallophosphoesterase family protein [Anaerolineae bacterium]